MRDREAENFLADLLRHTCGLPSIRRDELICGLIVANDRRPIMAASDANTRASCAKRSD